MLFYWVSSREILRPRGGGGHGALDPPPVFVLPTSVRKSILYASDHRKLAPEYPHKNVELKI